MVLLVGFVVSACDLGDDGGSSRPQPSTPVTIRGSDTPPPSSPPWTLADLVNHQCAVFDEADLARFGMVSPGVVGDGSGFCRWQSLPTAPTTAVMYFLPDIWRQFEDLEDAYRNEVNFRTLAVAGRPAFVEDDRNFSGTQTCQLWVSVPSGGTIQFEYALKNAGVVDE
ncbi:MAG: hypothetical protein DI630_34965, partial [Gordonia sp. (in: high G+C Gram-positive bacteria)]